MPTTCATDVVLLTRSSRKPFVHRQGPVKQVSRCVQQYAQATPSCDATLGLMSWREPRLGVPRWEFPGMGIISMKRSLTEEISVYIPPLPPSSPSIIPYLNQANQDHCKSQVLTSHTTTLTLTHTTHHKQTINMPLLPTRRRHARPVATHTVAPRRRGGLFSRRQHVHTTTHTTPVVTTHRHHVQKRHATLGDKISGAFLKLKGTLTGRPGQKAAGTRRMHGTDGRGQVKRRRRFF